MLPTKQPSIQHATVHYRITIHVKFLYIPKILNTLLGNNVKSGVVRQETTDLFLRRGDLSIETWINGETRILNTINRHGKQICSKISIEEFACFFYGSKMLPSNCYDVIEEQLERDPIPWMKKRNSAVGRDIRRRKDKIANW